MSLKRNSGVWTDVSSVKRYSGGHVDVAAVNRLNGTEWVKVWPEGPSPTNPPENEYYLYSPEMVWKGGMTDVWECPETNWYRIIVIGMGGQPGKYGKNGSHVNSHSRLCGGGGGGGGSGGIGVHLQYIHKREVFSVICDSEISQFGEEVYAYPGGDGKKGGDAPAKFYEYTDFDVSGGSGGSGGGAHANTITKCGYSGGRGGHGCTAHIGGDEWYEELGGYAYTGNGRSGDGPGGTDGEYTCSGSGKENGNHGGMGGAAGMDFIESIKMYHHNYNPGLKNYVDCGSKKVSYGTAAGWEIDNPFPGAVILEIYDP